MGSLPDAHGSRKGAAIETVRPIVTARALVENQPETAT
jgi:hypothetical protein